MKDVPLTRAIKELWNRVKTWPDRRQEDAADRLLAMQEQGSAPHETDEEQRERLALSLAQAARSEFATDRKSPLSGAMREPWRPAARRLRSPSTTPS